MQSMNSFSPLFIKHLILTVPGPMLGTVRAMERVRHSHALKELII